MISIIYVNDVVFSRSSGELTHTVGILNSLSRKGLNVDFVTREENLDLLQEMRLNTDINIIVAKGGRGKMIKKLSYYIKVASYFRKEYDYFYVRESFYSFLLLPLSLVLPRKIIFEFNGLRSSEVNKVLHKFIIRNFSLINRFIAKRAKCNISVASGIEKYLRTAWGLDNVVTINNGTEIVSNYKCIEERTSRAKKLVFIGNLAKWQNFDFLIGLVLKNIDYFMFHKIVFDIYGLGSEFDRLKILVDNLDLSSTVRFKGVLKKTIIPEVLSCSSGGLLVDTRFFENKPLFSPLKMYEYNCFNKPTIFFTPKTLKPFQKYGFFIINESNICSLHLILDEEFQLDQLCRSWDDVADDFLHYVF